MLVSFALIIIVGYLLSRVFEGVGVPGLIGMLLTGIILGPSVLNVLDEKLLSISSEFRELALLIILIRAGLSLNLGDFKKMGMSALFMSFVPAIFEMSASFVLSQYLFGFSVQDAAMTAAILASASPAVIVPRMLKLIKDGYGINKAIPQLILTSDSIDDVFNIVVFSSFLGLGNGVNISISQIIQIPISILLGISIGLLIGYMFSFVIDRISVTNITLLLLSIGFILFGVEERVKDIFPFSGLICTMSTAFMINAQKKKTAQRVESQLNTMWSGAQIVLFALVGALVEIKTVHIAGASALVMIVFVLIIRAIGIYLCLLGSNLNIKEKLFCMITGIPKATVQAAIGGIPLAMGFANGSLILSIATIAIVFTAPLGAFLIDRLHPVLLSSDSVIKTVVETETVY